jgi:hypothetical protein
MLPAVSNGRQVSGPEASATKLKVPPSRLKASYSTLWGRRENGWNALKTEETGKIARNGCDPNWVFYPSATHFRSGGGAVIGPPERRLRAAGKVVPPFLGVESKDEPV